MLRVLIKEGNISKIVVCNEVRFDESTRTIKLITPMTTYVGQYSSVVNIDSWLYDLITNGYNYGHILDTCLKEDIRCL